jgi:hypothetical protein
MNNQCEFTIKYQNKKKVGFFLSQSVDGFNINSLTLPKKDL